MKTIYELELHEELLLNNSLAIKRVPGGWIYFHEVGPVFVSMNMEFAKKGKLNPITIRKFIEDYFSLETPLIEIKTRKGNYPISRQILCRLLRDNTSMSDRTIAVHANFKNHSSVPSALKSIQNSIDTDPRRKSQYEYVRDSLNLK